MAMQVPQLSQGLTWRIIWATALGMLFGIACHSIPQLTAHAGSITAFLAMITTLFLRAIKMLIAPLVVATLVSGIGRMGDAGAVGRVAAKAMLWFVVAALVAIAIGFTAVELLQPGAGLHLKASGAGSGIKAVPFDAVTFIENLVPASVVDAMARNDVLPIVVFSLIAGLAITRMGDAGKALLQLAEALSGMMLQMAVFVMRFAPLAVFTAIAATFVERGAGVFLTYASYIGGYYLALAILWAAMVSAGSLFLGRRTQWELLKELRQPGLIAMATTSGEAAYPLLLQKLEGFGVPNRIASFVLPLGYSFNLIGSMCYCTFAALFIAQACDVPLTGIQIAQLLAMLFVTSKGIANVPRASLVVVAAAAPYFNLPEVGIMFVLGVDHLLDMGRTATNVVANAIVAACVSKWENPDLPLHQPSMPDGQVR